MKKNADMGYEKTNPIQTQFLQRPKMNVNSLITKDYRKNDAFAVQKNKPNQTQFKPNFNRRETNQRSGMKKRVSGTFLRLWVDGKIDFLDGCDILLGKIYGKSQFNLFWRLIL